MNKRFFPIVLFCVTVIILGYWSCARSQDNAQAILHTPVPDVPEPDDVKSAGQTTLDWTLKARFEKGRYLVRFINKGGPDAPDETMNPLRYWAFIAYRNGQKVPYTAYYRSLDSPYRRGKIDYSGRIADHEFKKNEYFEYEIDIPSIIDMSEGGDYDVYIERYIFGKGQSAWVVSNKIPVKVPLPRVIVNTSTGIETDTPARPNR